MGAVLEQMHCDLSQTRVRVDFEIQSQICSKETMLKLWAATGSADPDVLAKALRSLAADLEKST